MKPLGSGVYWEVLGDSVVCPPKENIDLGRSLSFTPSPEVNRPSLLCASSIVPWGTMLPQTQSNRTSGSQTKTSKGESPNKLFLFIIGIISGVCHRNGMLTQKFISIFLEEHSLFICFAQWASSYMEVFHLSDTVG